MKNNLIDAPGEDITRIFGTEVFNDAAMQERLPEKVYHALQKTIEEGRNLTIDTADAIAEEMRKWAVERGATHYTHWFQPLTGNTAEKHDSFITKPTPDGRAILSLSGKELIKGESDASSFPSGGLRATFEARGYTIWDCTSPAFIRHDEGGATLCIPTAFCSYTGEALDQKTPLLRSMEAINEQSLRLLALFGKSSSKKVTVNVGVEQEYFIIDREKYLKRKDLIFTGRTLFGAAPPKGQELDDHYFGTIRPKIASFMHDVNIELWKLGVPAKTEHNEVAPAQHELAIIYEEANIAADHNQVVMQVLKRVATRHGLRCLLHEKPFDGVNGSGKHNNWSLSTDDGLILTDPGKNPHENLLFLLVFACVIRAVDLHADLLKESAVSVGNERRLGGNEAPPHIISIFIGEQLQDVISQFMRKGDAKSSINGEVFHTGVSSISDFKKDATDRNRTSPFAFTGNKFEFRMVGSKGPVAAPNTVINTIVAESFCDACDRLEGSEDFERDCRELIREYLIKHKRIIFDGNGYSREWEEEALKRGLDSSSSFVDTVHSLASEKSRSLFEKFNVFTGTELESRVEVKYETYSKDINIEAKTMIHMAGKELIPAMISYAKDLSDTVAVMKNIGVSKCTDPVSRILNDLSECIDKAYLALKELEKAVDIASELPEGREKAEYYRDKVIPAMEELRKPVDAAELIVDKKSWPIPTYDDLMFEI